MRHKLLADYLDAIEHAVISLENVSVDNYLEEILTSERANLRIRIRFLNGQLLELNEAVVIENNKFTTLDYRYHFQNESNQLLFRYDNAPHFPNLATFPHHKHLHNETIASEKPTILEVLIECQNH
jgi:hypothetical protein